MRVRLDERVLHRFVRLGGVAQVVERDPRRAPLVPRDQLRVPLARLRVPPFGLQRLDGGGRGAVRFAGGDDRRRELLS